MDEPLRAELLRRVERDQVARRGLDISAIMEADGENLPWLKAVVAAHGWPGVSLVGTDGAFAAWLLAQHADADPAFQRQCLDVMSAAVAAGEARLSELAYLTDRVLLAEGTPQIYGTQVHHQDGSWQARDLRDPDRVDERRAAAGLEPLAEYLRGFDDYPVPSPTVQCLECGAWTPFERGAGDGAALVTCTSCGAGIALGGS